MFVHSCSVFMVEAYKHAIMQQEYMLFVYWELMSNAYDTVLKMSAKR